MAKIKQKIEGNNNVQVGRDYNVITTKTVKVTHNVVYDPETMISTAQAYEILDKIQKVGLSLYGESGDTKTAYLRAHADFKKKFKIPSYKLLPKDKFDEANKWLNKKLAIHRDGLKNSAPELYRNNLYKAIHTRTRQLGINIYEFAEKALNLNRSISSLKELDDKELEQLYTKLFSKK